MAAMSNWPHKTDLSHPNWTLRTPRERKRYSRYTPADERIPPVAWVVGLLMLALVFGFFPLLSLLML
jgi:hypothetical protein